MHYKNGFDFPWENVLAPNDEHLLCPAGDAQESVGVQSTDIAGGKPPLRVNDTARLFRLPVISFHHPRTTDNDFPVIPGRKIIPLRSDDADLHIANGLSDRSLAINGGRATGYDR